LKYLDSGSRDPAHTLASWLDDTLNGDVAELRLQTGFFSLDGIGLLIPALEQCKQNDHPTKVLIGSNDASTLKDDVIGLIDAMGIPRDGAQLGIVSFGGAFFHPKTYHLKRLDGSQAAFVGSANLTASGLALHVEAGIALDTRDGDAPHHLSQIAAAIDNWFAEQRAGMTLVTGLHSVDELVECGVLSLARPPRPVAPDRDAAAGGKPARPRLQRLYALPPVRPQAAQPAPQVAAAVAALPAVHAPIVASLPSVPRHSFPPYLLFQPNAIGPTVGASALTGSLLSGGSAGLIIQLNKDSARHFMGRTGTANISIPVATVSTLRFGISGKHDRPTGMFDLHLRFLGDNLEIDGGTPKTSVMGYGYTAAETGHGDIRMLVPAAARTLGESIEAAGKNAPTIDDLAFLEWPTLQDPAFRLTFLDTQSAIYQQALNAFNSAAATGQLVGNGACWLAAGMSPSW
jgi:HKD family nuclease